MDIKRLTPKSLIEWITGIISAIITLLTDAFDFLVSISDAVCSIASILFIISIIVLNLVDNEKIKRIAKLISIGIAVMLISSGALILYHRQIDKLQESNRILCELTEEALDEGFYVSGVEELRMRQGIKDNRYRYYSLFWQGNNDDHQLEDMLFDYNKANAYGLESVPFIHRSWNNTGTNQQLLLTDSYIINMPLNEKLIEPLPYSINLTLLGYLSLKEQNFSAAKSYFEQALEEGNGVAAYYLSMMYINGCGTITQDEYESNRLLSISSELGFRRAQYEYGHRLLLFGKESSDVYKGERLLYRALELSGFRSGPGMIIMEGALSDLIGFYERTGQYLKAYKLTKRISKKNGAEYILTQKHLGNCLSVGKYKEAMSIIREHASSENSQEAAYCMVVHAKMLQEGLGVDQDIAAAERLLRVASDSLDFAPARLKLSELYEALGYSQDAQYWRLLYQIGFHKTISALPYEENHQ